MTGNYPDIPGPRMQYDRDGTQVFTGPSYSSVTAQLTQAQMQLINGESAGGYLIPGSSTYSYARIFWIFPELRDIVGIFYGGLTTADVVQVSPDTTNGIDGTWTALSGVSAGSVTKTDMRNSIQAVTGATGIKGLRTGFNHPAGGDPYISAMHIYGTISAGQNPDRLSFWHPSLDQPLSQTPAWMDWGDRPRGTSATKQVRVKNISGSMTASNVTVGMEALTDTTPAMVGQHDFALDGVTFTPTVSIASLAPGEISPIITVRQTLASSASLSLWWQRIYANAGSWA